MSKTNFDNDSKYVKFLAENIFDENKTVEENLGNILEHVSGRLEQKNKPTLKECFVDYANSLTDVTKRLGFVKNVIRNTLAKLTYDELPPDLLWAKSSSPTFTNIDIYSMERKYGYGSKQDMVPNLTQNVFDKRWTIRFSVSSYIVGAGGKETHELPLWLLQCDPIMIAQWVRNQAKHYDKKIRIENFERLNDKKKELENQLKNIQNKIDEHSSVKEAQ